MKIPEIPRGSEVSRFLKERVGQCFEVVRGTPCKQKKKEDPLKEIQDEFFETATTKEIKEKKELETLKNLFDIVDAEMKLPVSDKPRLKKRRGSYHDNQKQHQHLSAQRKATDPG